MCATPYLYQHINISIINNFYLYQNCIDFQIKMTENKHDRMYKFKKVYPKI